VNSVPCGIPGIGGEEANLSPVTSTDSVVG